MNSIEVNNLTKVYDSRFKKNAVTALKDFNLNVESGSIFGLLGPNGAGKTTLIKILLGITFPTKGSASILGEDISNYNVRKKIGYLPENHKFPNYLTGPEVLTYFSKLSGYENPNLNIRIDEMLALVKMDQWKKMKIKKYSKGMMQRLGLAQAMINDPELIFLDEPTDGVDPIGRKEIRDILVDVKNQGKTIFLNSHLLSEVELITDRVAILNKGIMLREGDVKELTISKELFKITIKGEPDEDNIKSALQDFLISKLEKNIVYVKLDSSDEIDKVIDSLRKNNFSILSVENQKNTLEDMFISLINETEKKI
ncbi:MAG: ABC transporter ATP-binding protein [Bacteroidetes bacterium]|nr:ABC transporter ATP-binding protein [Bacteroidota bacterium]